MTPSLEKLDYQWCKIKMLDGVYRTDTVLLSPDEESENQLKFNSSSQALKK